MELSFYGKTAVVWTDGELPATPSEFLESEFFELVMKKYLDYLIHHQSPLLEVFPLDMDKKDYEKNIIALMKKLNMDSIDKIDEPELKKIGQDKYLIHQFVEKFYDEWRNFERYLVCLSKNGSEYDKKPYRTFRDTVEHMNHIFRRAYRSICENITGDHPRIYRQVSAGFQVGVIAAKKEWECPPDYSNVKSIPFIRQSLLYPPMIIDPLKNKRTGQFKRVDSNPIEGLDFSEKEWMCYPAKVGDLLIHIYFHDKFIGLGCALSNLFEMADDDEIKAKPDAIYAYGVPEHSLDKFGELPTMFYDDEKNEMMVAAVPKRDEFGYFGYLKKMVLTLHNIIKMKKGSMPIHGAMVRIELKNGKSANVMIVGDTGAGKSESLEAFRTLGEEYIRDMIIIFDDMGSIDKKKGLLAYGTETGAFVRLDDLQPGFAFGNLDRSIIMSPQKVNARAVIPVTTITEVLRGYKIDFFLYANNYEEIDEEHPILERITDRDDAFELFKEGAVMSKGTTTSTGLVHTYFANIFGPPQYKELHEMIASEYFDELFKEDVYVGQLRTRLGVEGYQTKGPEEAAKKLFEAISKN